MQSRYYIVLYKSHSRHVTYISEKILHLAIRKSLPNLYDHIFWRGEKPWPKEESFSPWNERRAICAKPKKPVQSSSVCWARFSKQESGNCHHSTWGTAKPQTWIQYTRPVHQGKGYRMCREAWNTQFSATVWVGQLGKWLPCVKWASKSLLLRFFCYFWPRMLSVQGTPRRMKKPLTITDFSRIGYWS